MDYSKFKTNCWKNLDTSDKRLKVLQELECEMAKKQGRTRAIEEGRTVVYKLLKEKICGFYIDESSSKLYINKRHLDSNDEFMNYEVVDIVIHEGYHAYQNDAVRGRRLSKKPKETKLQLWARNIVIKNDFEDDDNDYKNVDYRFQPRENDAYNYTYRQMKSLKLQDDDYNKYIDKQKNKNIYWTAMAKEKYGKNYLQIIAIDIDVRYAAYEAYMVWLNKDSCRKKTSRSIDKKIRKT